MTCKAQRSLPLLVPLSSSEKWGNHTQHLGMVDNALESQPWGHTSFLVLKILLQILPGTLLLRSWEVFVFCFCFYETMSYRTVFPRLSPQTLGVNWSLHSPVTASRLGWNICSICHHPTVPCPVLSIVRPTEGSQHTSTERTKVSRVCCPRTKHILGF